VLSQKYAICKVIFLFQFPDVVGFSDYLANHGKIVIVAALDGTFQKKAFGDILNLVPVSESVTKLTAVCTVCFKPAAFTRRRTSEDQVNNYVS
jgi:thymidine kinase